MDGSDTLVLLSFSLLIMVLPLFLILFLTGCLLLFVSLFLQQFFFHSVELFFLSVQLIFFFLHMFSYLFIHFFCHCLSIRSRSFSSISCAIISSYSDTDKVMSETTKRVTEERALGITRVLRNSLQTNSDQDMQIEAAMKAQLPAEGKIGQEQGRKQEKIKENRLPPLEVKSKSGKLLNRGDQKNWCQDRTEFDSSSP